MRTIFDAVVKLLFREVLQPCGKVYVEDEILVSPRRIDFWFQPTPNGQTPLGIFARMFSAGPSIVEAYHQTPDFSEWRACRQKQVALQTREKGGYPRLWVISAGKPSALIKAAKLQPAVGWPSGFYEAAPVDNTFLVVISELPRNRETLILRLMGAGKTLTLAYADADGLPPEAPERMLVMQAMLAVRRNVAYAQSKEGAMILEQYHGLYEKWEQETLQRGEQRGKQEGFKEGSLTALHSVLVSMYTARFGTIPEAMQAKILAIEDLNVLQNLVTMLMRSTEAEIAVALQPT